MQLDIFEDSRETALRNDVIREIERRDAVGARKSIDVLAAAFPDSEGIDAMRLLAVTLAQVTEAAFAHHEACREARAHLGTEIEPAARLLLGDRDAKAWAVPLWKNLARRAADLRFLPEQEEAHAASLWLAAGDWTQAVEAVKRIESWRAVPVPLAWMTQARYRLVGLPGVLDMAAELAWIAPKRWRQVVSWMSDPLLDLSVRDFEAQFELDGAGEEFAWLPAWMATTDTRLAKPLEGARQGAGTPPEEAMRIVLQLHRIEGQAGRHADVIESRQRLRSLNESLFKKYMSIRSLRA